MKIYVASSWRNAYHPFVVGALRRAGHEVYDFRNPRPGDNGFHWSEIDPKWEEWSPSEYRLALADPIALRGYKSDRDALEWCEALVLVLPSGRSAHLEAGLVAGQGKPTAVYIPERVEPELMYHLLRYVCVTLEEVVTTVGSWVRPEVPVA